MKYKNKVGLEEFKIPIFKFKTNISICYIGIIMAYFGVLCYNISAIVQFAHSRAVAVEIEAF